MAIKTAEYVHDFLNRNDLDFIESHDFFESNWIKTGMKEDRLIYRHYFNERTQSGRFYASYEIQKRMGLTREIPQDLQVMIGSQWWCLRRQTVEKILDFLRQRRDVVRFFATTWIPDETFFQTLVRHLIPRREIENRTLTFLMFSDYGMPVTFYNDHYDMLLVRIICSPARSAPKRLSSRKDWAGSMPATALTSRFRMKGAAFMTFWPGAGALAGVMPRVFGKLETRWTPDAKST